MRQVNAVNGSQMVEKIGGGLLPSGEGDKPELVILRKEVLQATNQENYLDNEE